MFLPRPRVPQFVPSQSKDHATSFGGFLCCFKGLETNPLAAKMEAVLKGDGP